MVDYLSQLYLPGALTLWCALLFALTALWGYSLVLRGDETAGRFARRAYGSFAISVVLAAVVLGFALMTRDFRIEYVYQYSGLDLPAHYQLAAFWAGQKGSFLIWLLWGALLGLPLARSAGRRHEPTVMTVYILTLLGLLFILVRENPFVMLTETPLDGKGLNPLLQDNWMVIHPPIMFVGFAAAAIPFSFAIAALWRKDYDGWAARAFPWALGGFMVLGVAILMGGYWAYKTLGWGGYWGWDPVENASLIPWIFGTVLIHGLYLERTKGRYRRINYVLAALVYLSVLYGTFLTRSGVLADFSVHSFVDLGISGWLIALMAFFFGTSLLLFVTRLRKVPTQKNEDPLLSRGSLMVLASIALLTAALVITFGTSAPLLTFFLENPGQVGPEFYNRVNLPIAILIALLLALVPFLTWRGITPRVLLGKIAPAAGVAALAAGFSALLGVHNPFHLLYLFLAVLALATNLQKVVSRAFPGGFARLRAKAGGGEAPAGPGLAAGLLRGLGVSGGYVAHVGVGIILVGFLASSAYDESAKATLELDQPQKVGDATLTFIGFLQKTSPRDKDGMVIEVERTDGSRFRSYPKMFRNERTGQTMANPDVRSFALADFYVSPLEYYPGEEPGAPRVVELARGQEAEIGGRTVRFAGFDMGIEGNAMAAMMSGADRVTIGAQVDIVGEDGVTAQAVPLYRMSRAQGEVETPPVPLPGGGTVTVASIDASNGMVRLAFADPENPGAPPTLSVDVTRKPLIQLVWLGLYVVLSGGILAIVNRFRQLRKLGPAV